MTEKPHNPKPRVQLPVGRNDFREIIEGDMGFVDKSLFMKELLDDAITEVAVITRPRRFGKTLNLSMLHYFLAAEVLGKPTKGLFDQLKIAQCGEKYMGHQGQYPVVSVTFKDIRESSFEQVLLAFSKRLRDLYKQHTELLSSDKLDDNDKKTFQSVIDKTADSFTLKDALKDLTRYLYLHHGTKPWLLIDEYDSPIHTAYANGYYDEMVDFMRSLLGAALKDNVYLKKAVVTGILRISNESLFSGLNNLRIYSILHQKYSEHFGFTESEVHALLRQGELLDKENEIREWYKGYRFGETTIYNPWSIANYLSRDCKPTAYWVNTSDNQLIKDLLRKAPLDFKQDFETLLSGGSVTKVIDGNMVFRYLGNNPQGVWSLLLMSGYLKPLSTELTDRGDRCDLVIPNREIGALYRDIIEQWLANGHGVLWYDDFLQHLLTGQIEKFKTGLQSVVLQIVSYHDLVKEPEAFYHGLMLGFAASLSRTYEIKSNRESGLGRFDIMLIPKDTQQMGVILELKIKTASESLEQAAARALQQIEDRQYTQELQQRGITKTVKVGIGFEGKEFALASWVG